MKSEIAAKKRANNRREINRRIAIACGWKLGIPNSRVCYSKTGNRRLITHSIILPDYYGSLDAMHEAEKTLSDNDQLEYMSNLGCLCFGTGDQAQDTHWNYIHATSAQRAEAFLRTIGQWEVGRKPQTNG